MTLEQCVTNEVAALAQVGLNVKPCDPNAIHELVVVLEPRFMDTYWEMTLGSHKDFDWTHYEQSCERLMNKIRTGNTIQRIVVTRRV